MRRIAIGEVLGPHGAKGELRVQPLTDFPERFYDLEWVYLGDEGKPRPVQSIRKHTRFFLVKLEGIRNEEDAHAVRGRYLCLPQNRLVKLPAGHFYLWELEGLTVYSTGGQQLGVVEEVLVRPANDVYVVRDAKGREILIPALREVVVDIDLKAGRMVVSEGPSLDWEGEAWR